MVLLESKTIDLGALMPNFNLYDVDQHSHSKDSLMGENGLLIIFTCNHCPYAIAIWDRLIALDAVAKQNGINIVAINPNIHPNYPDDAPEKMREKRDEWGIPFPYLIDQDQSVAKAYDAQCTPDLYLLDRDSKLRYHGRLDDNWREPSQVTKEELKSAIINLGSGNPISTDQFPSMGCSIKWQD